MEQLFGAITGIITIGTIQLFVLHRQPIIISLCGCLFDCLFDNAQLTITIQHIVHSTALGAGQLLGHMGNSAAGGNKQVAGIRGNFTEQQFKQAGFTAAIATDNSHMLPGVNHQLCIVEQDFAATAKLKITQGYHCFLFLFSFNACYSEPRKPPDWWLHNFA